MPKDTEEELKRLENWLLSEEAQETASRAKATAPSKLSDATKRIYNSDHTDIGPDDLSEEVLSPKKDSLMGFVLIFILLCLGILCVLAYWLLRWKGVIG